MHGKEYVRLMNSKEWRQLRREKLSADPYCEECLKRGIHRLASVVHHKTEVESGQSPAECRRLAFDPHNLESVCPQCHRDIHKGRKTWGKDNHIRREKERLAQWKARLRGPDTGDSAPSDTGSISQHAPSGHTPGG